LSEWPYAFAFTTARNLDFLSSTFQSFRNIIANDDISVLFREENKNADGREFNKFVKTNYLNNPIDNNTKIVYINNSKLPKPLVQSGWQPEVAIRVRSHRLNKNIAMFCTGGIRCEKASSLLKKKGYKNIYHLQGGILQYLDDIPKEKNLFEGECYVFDKRVALDQDLEKGSYSICHACGMPISIQDQERKEYRKGIQCHFCIDQFSDDDRKRFEERQKQIDRSKVENNKIY